MKKSILLAILLIILHGAYSYGFTLLSGSYDRSLIENEIKVPVLGITPDYASAVIGNLSIGKITGSQGVLIFDNRQVLDGSTIESILTSIEFAENYSGTKGSYLITYELGTEHVSGKSSGSAAAIGAIALLKNKSINHSVIITGEIDRSGNLLETGGIIQKSIGAAKNRYRTVILPKNQSKTFIYEKKIDPASGIYFVLAKAFDIGAYLNSTYGATVVEASNIGSILNLTLI